MYAAFRGNPECVQALADSAKKRLDVNATAKGGSYKGRHALLSGVFLAGKTALDVALAQKEDGTAAVLRELGAKRAILPL